MVEGILAIDSTPGGATIYINGVKQPDPTPGGILIAPGTYNIRLTWPGYYDWVSTVTVVATYQGQVTRITAVMTLAVVHLQRGQSGPGMLYFVVNGVKLGATQGSVDVKPGDVIGLIVELGGIGAKFDKIIITSVKAGVGTTKTYTDPTGISFTATDEFYDVQGYFTQVPLSTIAFGTFISEPGSAGVFIDGKNTGQVTSVTIDNIAAGKHSYELRLFGYEVATGTFLAEIGKSFVVFANMVSCPPTECEPGQTGYEQDGCGNRRLNPVCGQPVCTPDWQCEPGLTGWGIDGCGNRRENPACVAIPPAKGSSKKGLYLAIGTTAFIGGVGFVAMTRRK